LTTSIEHTPDRSTENDGPRLSSSSVTDNSSDESPVEEPAISKEIECTGSERVDIIASRPNSQPSREGSRGMREIGTSNALEIGRVSGVANHIVEVIILLPELSHDPLREFRTGSLVVPDEVDDPVRNISEGLQNGNSGGYLDSRLGSWELRLQPELLPELGPVPISGIDRGVVGG